MNTRRVRLINAARKALFQRAQLKRSANGARQNFAPQALKQRAKKKVTRRVDAAVEGAERGLRKYALPLGLTALAGLAFAFRRPLIEAGTALAEQADKAAKALGERFDEYRNSPPPTDDEMDQPHEPV
jgi:hypothetical protein